jgi:hypothetical protein
MSTFEPASPDVRHAQREDHPRVQRHKLCPLECSQRTVEDLGEIASFQRDESHPPSLIQRIKEVFRL